MDAVLRVTFPFFALVLCGYGATRRGLLPQTAIAGLNAFVLYFALPCMLYRFGAAMPIERLLDVGVAGVYGGCALVLVSFALALALGAGWSWRDAAFGALVTAFPNTGFMGVPLLVALLGEGAAGPVIVTILVDMVFTSSLCIALSQLAGADVRAEVDADSSANRRGMLVALQGALKGVVLNPMPWAIGLGALASALGVQPLEPLAKTLRLLADAASPVALFTIGAVLARRGQETGRTAPPWRDCVPLALAKLLLHPLLVLLLGGAALRLGLGLERFSLVVLVLVAALPSASNVSLLTERFGANTAGVARVILVSTSLAFLSFSGLIALLLR